MRINQFYEFANEESPAWVIGCHRLECLAVVSELESDTTGNVERQVFVDTHVNKPVL